MTYGVILAGGKGERFWPLSRAARPKQFLKLTSDRMMLEETMARVMPMIPRENMRIVTSRSMSGFILDSVEDITDHNVLSEPFGRNTCAAIALAAVHLIEEDPDAVLVVLSADHLIRPANRLLRILQDGVAIAAKDDVLLTVGVVPTRPETGYGYIKVGENYAHDGDAPVYRVSAFTEKPRRTVAKEYYFSGKYLWNSGMFIWSAKALLKAVSECQPELWALLGEYREHIGKSSEIEARLQLYQNASSISIDFAVLEKASNVLTVKADIVWDDVGDWNSLARYKEKDSDGNVLIGDSVNLDSYEMTVYNDSDGIIACLGVSDLVVVRSGDITMVTHKTRAEDIKKLLARLGDDEKTRKYL